MPAIVGSKVRTNAGNACQQRHQTVLVKHAGRALMGIFR